MRAFTITLLLLCLLPLAGCEDMGWRHDRTDDRAGSGSALGPAATYERRLLFLATGPELPAAATFDFTAVPDSAGLRRTAGIQLAADRRWTRLLEGSWSTDRIREPWRILPHGELRVVVNDAGEVDALALSGDPGLRVEPGPLLAESSPDAGTQLVLRAASLTTEDSTYRGVLLDAQVGRAVETPSAAPTSIEALLAHGSGYHAVVVRAAGGHLAWVNDDGESRIHRGVRLEQRGEGPEDEGPGDEGATVWLIAGLPELSGRLRIELADTAAVPGYALVSGWVEDDGVRRDVFGLVRQTR
jgi:hypothetical protein